MYMEFRECLHDEIAIMQNTGIFISDSTIIYYETIYSKGQSPCPACFIRKNRCVAMKCVIHADIFECPECDEFIEVGG
ncbi:hypothetical protein [Shewanella surugensis]|uniref:TerY-C metal binding domain-containing protein n=1 Tax=Shewanella surugensis TaxID=212020 RepID=A0ABT0LGA1_9GAMM|nr:hypothetical protein [Shewanella surugensis]MCL1126727.1 hypothetical protein [Shewanella surugensis]